VGWSADAAPARGAVNPMQVTSPYWFFGVSGLIVAYLLYMMIRKRKGERPGSSVREPEL
jgi:hypothetical protein